MKTDPVIFLSRTSWTTVGSRAALSNVAAVGDTCPVYKTAKEFGASTESSDKTGKKAASVLPDAVEDGIRR